MLLCGLAKQGTLYLVFWAYTGSERLFGFGVVDMTVESNLLPRLMMLQKTLFASLRLKDVLEAAVLQYTDLTGGAKVAIFLSDNDSLSLKLMNAKGYSNETLEQLRVLSFSAETVLKHV